MERPSITAYLFLYVKQHVCLPMTSRRANPHAHVRAVGVHDQKGLLTCFCLDYWDYLEDTMLFDFGSLRAENVFYAISKATIMRGSRIDVSDLLSLEPTYQLVLDSSLKQDISLCCVSDRVVRIKRVGKETRLKRICVVMMSCRV